MSDVALREALVQRATVTPVAVLVGAVMTNLALALALFVVASVTGSLILLVGAAWLLVPMGLNVYLLTLDVER